jgi:hypothetical protein
MSKKALKLVEEPFVPARKLCAALNSIPGVATFSSYCGKQGPFTDPPVARKLGDLPPNQLPPGTFSVNFWVHRNATGLRAIGIVACACQSMPDFFGATVRGWFNGNDIRVGCLAFELSGTVDSEDLAAAILRTLRAVDPGAKLSKDAGPKIVDPHCANCLVELLPRPKKTKTQALLS